MNLVHESVPARPSTAPPRWPEPLTMAEWDRRFRGIFDAVGIMGGAANVILQLARRGVGYGVVESRVESGQVFRHPIKRTRTTLTYLAVATLGTTEEKLAYRKAVTRVHALVRSTDASPVKYSALDPSLQLWVAACLYWGFVDTWSKLRGEPDAETADALYRQLSPLATTLQVAPEMWPADRAAFDAYWHAGLADVHIDETVRAYLTAVTELRFFPRIVSAVLGPLNRFLTAGFLPASVREQMRFAWGPKQQRRFERFLGVVAVVNRMLPRFIRQAPVMLLMMGYRRRLRRGMPLV